MWFKAQEGREDFWIFHLDTLHPKGSNQKRALKYWINWFSVLMSTFVLILLGHTYKNIITWTTVADYYILSDFKFRCPATDLKLSTEDLDIWPRVWVWIRRLAYISSAEVFGFKYLAEGFIKSGPWNNLVSKWIISL